MIAVIDNYDSFTYNLVQCLGHARGRSARAPERRDHVKELEKLEPDGPCHLARSREPRDAGITEDAIRALAGTMPILGVCPRPPGAGEVYGGKVVRAPRLMHGRRVRSCTRAAASSPASAIRSRPRAITR